MKHAHNQEIFVLYSTVFITGLAVLVLEVAAIRMLAIYFGNSLYVLSSILSVILAALALGYFFGGRCADRYPTPLVLYTLISAAGLALLLVYVLSGLFFPSLSDVFGLIWGPLVLAGFFLIPAFLLGVDSPYVIRLLSRDSSSAHAGKVAGTTFCLSTVGSIVGSILAGFWLIPTIGTQLTIISTAGALIVLGILGILFFQSESGLHYKALISILLTIAIAGVLLLLFGLKGISAFGPEVIYATDGLYSHVQVREQRTQRGMVRSLRLDSSMASSIFLDPELRTYHPYLYAQYAKLYQATTPDARDFLLIGGGGYTIPRYLLATDESLQITVIEPEKILLDIAHTYLDLPRSDRLTNVTNDGRVYVRTSPDDSYDVIFANAMQTGLSIPTHLVTTEYFLEIDRVLRTDGVFILNVIGTLREESPSLLGSINKTLESVFPSVSLYKVHTIERPGPDNFIFVAQTEEDLAGPHDIMVHDYDLQHHPAAERHIPLPYKDLSDEHIFIDNKTTLIERLLVREYQDF